MQVDPHATISGAGGVANGSALKVVWSKGSTKDQELTWDDIECSEVSQAEAVTKK